ncbi:hypothetical protein ACIQNK_28045 [Streptomyces sp. NPDC091273]|uniref:hypothetical protein n=1 Tax=Streptomyces sp. NPDC091273 TaxID=3365982 RepID=UPI003810C40F
MATDFDQEWGRERADGADRQVGLRLNSGPQGPFAPGGSKEFASTPAEKRAAAGVIQDELESAAEHADEATSSARKDFDGWQAAAGLKKVAESWDQQVKTLMGRLSSEKVALRGAESVFARNDTGVGSQFLKSALNGV